MLAIRLVAMTARDLVASHLVWLLPVAILLLAVLAPAAAKAVLVFLTRTLPGQIIAACVVAGLVGWFVRGFIDDAANRTATIRAAAAETARADEARKAADARLAALRQQVEAAAALTRAATDRADAATAAVAAYQDREDEYEAALDVADRKQAGGKVPGNTGSGAGACALDDADLRGLRRAAAVFGPGDPPGAAAGAGRLRPRRRRP